MKKFIDDPNSLLDTSLQGFAKAHADILDLNPEPRFVYRKQRKSGKVALISGGGSGHEPLHSGFVASACSTPPAPAKCSPRRRRTR